MNHWEKDLERDLVGNPYPHGAKAYVCSPLSSSSRTQMRENMRNAKAYMFYVLNRMVYDPCAPHACLPLILNDARAKDRETALKIGLLLLEGCRVLFVCGARMSEGMRGEIRQAAKKKIRIIVFNENLYEETKRLAGKSAVHLADDHPFLAMSTPAAHADAFFHAGSGERVPQYESIGIGGDTNAV